MVQLRQMNALVDMLADVKSALRRFNKSPGFTVIAVVTLALGIGATAAIFTLIQQVMLQSLAVAKPEQLWRIGDAVTCLQRHAEGRPDGGQASHPARARRPRCRSAGRELRP